MKVLLSKSVVIEAAHNLKAHQGKCHRVHGHSWKLEVTVESEVDKATHMGLDYYELSYFLTQYVDAKLDHQDLNQVFREENPTSEFLADWLFSLAVAHFEEQSGFLKVEVAAVSVWETARTKCTLTRAQWRRG